MADAYFSDDGIQPVIDMWDDSSDDDSDDDIMPPVDAPHVAKAPADEPLVTKAMNRGYVGEQVRAGFRLNMYDALPLADSANAMWGKAAKSEDAFVSQVRTRYLSPAEQDAHTLGFGEATEAERKHPTGPAAGKRAVRGPGTATGTFIGPRDDRDVRLRTREGKLADTSKASGSLGLAEEGAHTFVMAPDRSIRALDPWKQRRDETPSQKTIEKPDVSGFQTDGAYEAAYASYKDKKKREVGLSLLNHSSLAAVVNPHEELAWGQPVTNTNQLVAGEVGGAGEVKLSEGHLDQLSDKSGHYEPDNRMTAQVLGELKKKGVDLYDTTVKLEDKPELHAPRTHNPALYASAREFELATGKAGQIDGARANEPQALMQSYRRGLRGDLSAELTDRNRARDTALSSELPAASDRREAVAASFGTDAATEARSKRFHKIDDKAVDQLSPADRQAKADVLRAGGVVEQPFGGRVAQPEPTWLDDRFNDLKAGASSVIDTVGTGLSSLGATIGSGMSAAWDWAAGGLSSVFSDSSSTSQPKAETRSSHLSQLFEGYL